MITPETWNFPPPPSSLVSQSVTREDISKFIESQQFNNLVCVTLPDCVQSPEKIKSLLSEDCEYYKIKKLPLIELIKPVFVQGFVKKGKLLALSSNAKFDLEDCFAFTEEGDLQLSVQTQTYQTLGLEGKAQSRKTSNTHGTYRDTTIRK